MALKALGQARPATGVTATVYQAGLGKSAVANVIICNTDIAAADSFILYHVPSAGAPSVSNAIFRGTIPAEESFCAFGIALAAGESIRLYVVTGTLTITITGSES